jgi:hypothetical protein
MGHDNGGRSTAQRPGRNAVTSTPPPSEAKGIVAGCSDVGDPSRIGQLLGDWLGLRMEQIDALVDEAEAKIASIPDVRTLRQMIGEWVVETYWLQAQLTELKLEVKRLKARQP